MADNVTFQSTTIASPASGVVIATDDDGTAQHQYVKLEFGADGTFTKVTSAVGLPVSDAGGSLTVDNAALSVTGGGVEASALRVTIASDSTGVLSVDDNGATLSIDDGGGNISIDDGGNTITVDGTVAVTNGGTFAVQVDGNALTSLQLIDNLVLLEDAASANGDPGVQVFAVRDDTLNVRSGTEGDYEPLHTDANGALWVRHTSDAITVASHAVTNAGTFAVQVDGAALTSLQLIDDAVYAEDVAAQAADKGLSVLAVRRDTASSMVGADNDYTNLIVDSSGRLHVNVGNSVTVASHAVTNAGTFAVQVDGSALTALQLIDDVVYADDAAFTLTSSKVAAIGAIRDDAISALSAAETDVVPLRVNASGALWNQEVNSSNITTAVQLIDDIVLAEDAAHVSGDKGVMALAVRQDAQADFGADGDYVPLSIDADGNLRTVVSGISVTGATEYTEGDTDASLTGPVVMMEVAADAVAPIQGTVAGGLLVNLGSNNDVTVTGTVAVTQSGTWDEVGINDSGNSITVDNGGTFVVQENGSWVQADDAAFTPATSKVAMVGAEFDDTGTDSVDEGDGGALRMSANRNLYVRIRDNAGNERGLNIDANGEFQVSGIRNAITVSSHAVTNAGTFVVQENGSALTALQLIDDGVYTDDTSTHSTGTSKGYGIMAVATPTDASVNANDFGHVGMTTDRKLHVSVQDALPAGTNAIGKLAANSGVDIGDVDVTSIAAGSNLIGDVGLQPRTTNGLTTFMASGSDGSSILVATAQAIKASAGKLYGYYAYNPEAAVTFVHFYNTAAASVTVGTTNPLFTLAIPAGSAANLFSDIGITFSNAGWSCAATTTAGGNTAPATGVSLVAWYA